MTMSDPVSATVVVRFADDSTLTAELRDDSPARLHVDVQVDEILPDVALRFGNVRYRDVLGAQRSADIRLRGVVTSSVLASGSPTREQQPWCLDVPVVPPHVTCLKDVDEDLWFRSQAYPDHWSPGSPEAYPTETIGGVMTYGPLVEHPDPRKATT